MFEMNDAPTSHVKRSAAQRQAAYRAFTPCCRLLVAPGSGDLPQG
ncbi:hypothetical protein [Burkholderia anthina]|nr:hypothetical protein [Burkholderia anthina]